MALVSRCFYRSTIDDFINSSVDNIFFHLSDGQLRHFRTLTDTQKNVWLEEIDIMKKILQDKQ